MTREELLEEIERQQKWLDGAGYTAYNIDIMFSSLYKNIKALEQEPKTKCNYCHTDSDECIEPLDKNAHIYLYPISGVRLKGEHMEVAYREYAINYCPICGRKLSETPTNTESEVEE